VAQRSGAAVCRTLSGTLEFDARGGERFTIRPGDILLAQDNTGTGHRWKLIGDEPWPSLATLCAG
jgi:quercetin dioxygenase-like cupin family protein